MGIDENKKEVKDVNDQQAQNWDSLGSYRGLGLTRPIKSVEASLCALCLL